MKYFLFLTTSFLLLTACNSNTIVKKPENLIPEDKMVNIIYDSYIAKAARNKKNKNADINLNYHALLYDKYNTDSITFHKSLKYYTSDIKQNEEILKQVKKRVDKELLNAKKELDTLYSNK